MKVEILKENLKQALTMVEKSVGRNASLPALGNTLLEAKDTFLQCTATDLETAVRWWSLAKVSEKGKALVPVRFMLNILSYLSDEKVTLELSGHDVKLSGRSMKTKIQGLNPDDFPLIPSVTPTASVRLDAGALCYGLGQVCDMAAVSQVKPELSGIYFSFSKQTLKMAATDSFRLAEKTITFSESVPYELSFIFPQRSARELIGILEGREGVVVLSVADNQSLFEFFMKDTDHLQFQMTSRLIEGEYPRYQDIIPASFQTQATAARNTLLDHIRAAGLFSGKTSEVRLLIQPQQGVLEVSAKSAEVGENSSSTPIKATGEERGISFNYKYLIDGLSHMGGDEVKIGANREDGPCVISPVGDMSYLYVVMPIKPI